MRYSALKLAGAGVVGLAASTASANAILTFGFTDLSGSYDYIDDTSGTMSAVAVDEQDLQTSGDVTRLALPGGTAQFNVGFMSRSAFADVVLTMNITNRTATDADGNGSIVITDDDGDTITATLMGTFSTPGAGITFFTGYLSNVGLTGSSFDGTDGGSFDTDLPGNEPYSGAVVQLFINSGGGFFNSDFDSESIQVDGIIVPTPATLALMGAGGLCGFRRRRG